MKKLLLLLILLAWQIPCYSQDYVGGYEQTNAEIFDFTAIATPATSTTNTARIYYNPNEDKLKLSVNNGNFSNIFTIADDHDAITVSNTTDIDLFLSTQALNATLNTTLKSNYETAYTHSQNTTSAHNLTIANVPNLNAANTFGAYNQTFDTNTFFIDSVNNRVAIGTTTPLSLLHMSGDSPGLRITNTDTTGIGQVTFFENAGIKGAVNMVGSAYTTTSRRNVLELYSGNDLSLWSGGTESVRIKSGSVGIGTTLPATTLDVNGTINATTYTGGNITNYDTAYTHSQATTGTVHGLNLTAVNATEFSYLDGVTSAIQTQLDSKGTSNLTANDTVYGAGWNGTTTEVPSQNVLWDKIETISAGAQTPWAQNIDGGGYNLTNATNITAVNFIGTGVCDFGGATSFEIPNAANPTLGTTGMIAINTADKTLELNNGANQISFPTIHILQGPLGTGDYDTDPDVWLIDSHADTFPHGIYITKVYVDCNEADPTTELNADLKYCDAVADGAFPGANVTVIQALDTTTGNMANATVNTAVATGKSLYITIDIDPTSDTTIFHVRIHYYIPTS